MSNELDLRDYVRILRKRMRLILVIVLLSTLAATIYSMFLQEPVYQASTKIIVNRSAADVIAQPLDLNQINTNIRMIETYKEIIKTPAIMDLVVAEHPEFALTAEELIARIGVSAVNDTQVMTLSIQDADYRRAAEMVNAVSVIFQQEIPKLFNIENVSILNQAKLELTPEPVSPNVPLNVAIGFVVSLMIAVGLAFLLEYMDDTLKTEQDVEQLLGLPIMGMITRVDDADKQEAAQEVPTSYTKAGELERVSVK
ncbi:lipopolysaccharide biosynthesis protein [Paenibacillus sp. IB182496]|uniref:Lipopolysaccharide biosynthesis protein n=1 Tax=Paenibacillus sabuli TaxID=2772509 RepID=A0A927BXJ1_9BACL|nr:Wzz/FepE/Etk N-terminal domain-containing protein [Paenibacillus sabuli]MBD2847565.1 lipopolysaccharide biosynthesis protein [Paenibacillus sabuli]